jgi:hypothetical protein
MVTTYFLLNFEYSEEYIWDLTDLNQRSQSYICFALNLNRQAPKPAYQVQIRLISTSVFSLLHICGFCVPEYSKPHTTGAA